MDEHEQQQTITKGDEPSAGGRDARSRDTRSRDTGGAAEAPRNAKHAADDASAQLSDLSPHELTVAKDSFFRRRNALIFFPIVAFWLAVDVATKAFFDTFSVGDVVAVPLPGIIEFRLVHNTGAAWGMFDNATILLGLLSIVVCVLLTVYLFLVSPRTSAWGAFGLALVCAGGIGNAIDRFTQGYVVDFIATTFIDFPVFNVADIGVTCGFVIFFISLIVSWVHDRKEPQDGSHAEDTQS